MKIISGGQTGVDRAALAWAIAHRIPHGGWCPRNREAEDGTIPPQFELTETSAEDSLIRTQWNVRDSDGTVILSLGPNLTGGSELTFQIARKLGKPLSHLYRSSAASSGSALVEFTRVYEIRTLNVAGPRASEEPGISLFVQKILTEAFLDAR